MASQEEKTQLQSYTEASLKGNTDYSQVCFIDILKIPFYFVKNCNANQPMVLLSQNTEFSCLPPNIALIIACNCLNSVFTALFMAS